MEFFYWISKFFYLFLMLSKVPTIDTRPLRGGTQHSDLIAGNEFLKLFLEREDLHSGEYRDIGGGGEVRDQHSKDSTAEIATISKTSSRSTSARSLDYSSRNANEHANDDDSKQVVKLVTSGSKIVFLEEYDDDDAAVDAVARDIDIKKEKQKVKPHGYETYHSEQYHQHHSHSNEQEHHQKSNPSDEIKVVAVSVSSSSKRGNSRERSSAETRSTHVNSFSEEPFSKRIKDRSPVDSGRRQSTQQQQYQLRKSQQKERATLSTSKPLVAKTTSTAATTARATTKTTLLPSPSPKAIKATSTTPGDFINRSHKSEFSIEEVEPLTMSQHRNFPSSPSSPSGSYVDVGSFYDTDSENSASTNIHKVLAAPLVRAPPSKPVSDSDSSNSGATYHSSDWNVTRINQNPSSSSHSHVTHADNHMPDASSVAVVEDKLLPFQTVIYHDTKEGHGPQSRSISYSSISQNVEDLHAWQKSGILAEAQRNVSESLKPASHVADQHDSQQDSEPSKFYSMPAKMYSVPAKFYSEPAKVYSEPAKVYGEPEKFYSEPAKVYGQPSKFYSEPSKVYSQPAKVYGEPAKTYWPRSSTSPPTISTTTVTAISTTTPKPSYSANSSSRRPAIVSRIAFGESQTTQSPTHSGHQTSHANRHPPHLLHSHHHSHSNAESQPRRILFNLDKLPYDLLNAPEQSAQHIFEPDLPKHSPSAATSSISFGRQRPCLEPQSQSSSATSSTSQQQHSSLLDQHSNQNAKGLPNRDLVKCVSKYSHSAASPSAQATARQRHPSFTTERSHSEELYTPTPEQNYEIEESVSVMTNGRAHGVQGIGPLPTTTTTSRSRIRGEGIGGIGFNGTQQQHGNSGAQYNTNANANEDGNGEEAAEDNYDDSDNDGNADNEGDADDYDSSDAGNSRNKNNDNNSKDDDDSKVAYVVEGRNYRKYRVEEKTDDGFIVGEYGVVDHNDGNLRGVRYTADSTINRSLIQKALLTFLKLK